MLIRITNKLTLSSLTALTVKLECLVNHANPQRNIYVIRARLPLPVSTKSL